MVGNNRESEGTVTEMMHWHSWEILHQKLFNIGETPVSLFTLAAAVSIIAAAYATSRLTRRALQRGLKRRGVESSAGVKGSLQALHYSILIIGIGVALSTAGIQLSALFAAGAGLAVGIGFGLQNFVQNVAAGVTLIVERSVRAGDILEVEGTIVQVKEMRLRSTVATTRDSEWVILPNASLVQARITNLTMRKDENYRLRVAVGVSYGSDLALVRRVLKQVGESMPWRIADSPVVVFLEEFGSSSVNYELAVWCTEPWEARVLRSELREAVWAAFKENHITIAFPQVDVHFDPAVTDAIGRRAA
jgi:small-conductance mechanosensitive channel